jgi:hypothetical protein
MSVEIVERSEAFVRPAPEELLTGKREILHSH